MLQIRLERYLSERAEIANQTLYSTQLAIMTKTELLKKYSLLVDIQWCKKKMERHYLEDILWRVIYTLTRPKQVVDICQLSH